MKSTKYPQKQQQQIPQSINHGNGIVEQYISPENAFTTNVGFLKRLAPTFVQRIQGNPQGGGNYGATGISNFNNDYTNPIVMGSYVNPNYSYISKTSFLNDYLRQGQEEKNLLNSKYPNQYKTKFAHSEREGYRDAVGQLIDQHYNGQNIVKPSNLGRVSKGIDRGLDARYQLDRDPTAYRDLMNQNGHVLNSWSELKACNANNSELGSGCSDWVKGAYPNNSQIGYVVKDWGKLKDYRTTLKKAYDENQQQLSLAKLIEKPVVNDFDYGFDDNMEGWEDILFSSKKQPFLNQNSPGKNSKNQMSYSQIQQKAMSPDLKNQLAKQMDNEDMMDDKTYQKGVEQYGWTPRVQNQNNTNMSMSRYELPEPKNLFNLNSSNQRQHNYGNNDGMEWEALPNSGTFTKYKNQQPSFQQIVPSQFSNNQPFNLGGFGNQGQLQNQQVNPWEQFPTNPALSKSRIQPNSILGNNNSQVYSQYSDQPSFLDSEYDDQYSQPNQNNDYQQQKFQMARGGRVTKPRRYRSNFNMQRAMQILELLSRGMA